MAVGATSGERCEGTGLPLDRGPTPMLGHCSVCGALTIPRPDGTATVHGDRRRVSVDTGVPQIGSER